MADPSEDSKADDVPNNENANSSPPPSPRAMSIAANCSILSFCVGIPMLAGSGFCIALFFPSIIIAGPLLLIGGVYTISGIVLRQSTDISAYIPLIVALAATVAYLIWINLPHGGA